MGCGLASFDRRNRSPSRLLPRVSPGSACKHTQTFYNHLSIVPLPLSRLAPLLKAHEEATRSGPISDGRINLQQVAEIGRLHRVCHQYWLVDHADKLGPESFRLLSSHSTILSCDNRFARHVLDFNDTSRNEWVDACVVALATVAETSKRNDLEYWCVSAFTHISRFATMLFAVCTSSYHLVLTTKLTCDRVGDAIL